MAHQFGNDQRLDAGWLALTNRLHLEGARYLDRLLESFPTPEAIIKGLHGEAGRDVVIAIKQAFRQSAPNVLSRGLTTELPLWLVTPQDVEYPPLLAECEDRPPFLFVRGELECLGARTLSVVGTRKPSLGGRKATAELTAAAVSAGQVIVSGLALGVDGIAHQAALQAGGASIAVLPCGIDRVYPRRHTVLAERLIQVGAVVSEFPLGTPPRKHHFHRRNRTLSGFSMSTLVVEAGRPSGTLLTASAAADQGRDVLTLPWSIYHVGGAGCRYLLSDGATLIQSAEDLLIHLGVHAVAHVDIAVSDDHGEASARSDSGHQPKLARHVVESDQQILLRLLGEESHSAEACSIALGWHVDRCLQGLSELEVAGRVVRAPHGYCALP